MKNTENKLNNNNNNNNLKISNLIVITKYIYLITKLLWSGISIISLIFHLKFFILLL